MALKILHIATERTWRGGEQQVFGLVDGLRARGHANIVAARRGGEIGRRLREAGVRVVDVAPWGEINLWEGARLRRFIRAEGVSAVHAHTGHAVSLGALATRGTGVPFLLTRRVDFPVGANPLSRWKYAKADVVVAISQGVRQVLEQSGVDPRKIRVVPSGVDFRRFEDVAAVSRDKMGIPAGALVIGQVAALAPHKDQPTLLRAFALLLKIRPDAHLVCVGDGPERRHVEAVAAELGLGANLHFLGFQSRPLDYLAAFDIFCLSSYAEGLGTSLIDAMALGIPIVATRAGGIPELVEDGVTGLSVPISDPGALAAALDRMAGSPALQRQFVDAARVRARNFDIVHTVSTMEQVYQELTKSA